MKKIFTILALITATLAVNAQFVDFELEIWKGGFAVADIDNDGDLDIIVSGDHDAGNQEMGAILINDGTGNFVTQEGERVITMGRNGNIKFGDIDGDGDLDVIFAGWGTNNPVKAGIALNDGNGVFTLAGDAYPISNAPKITACGFADFDLNGLLDYYFFGNDLGNCIIYFQQPDGTFEPSSTALKAANRFDGAGDPIDYKFNEPEVTIVDFDNDGDPDIFINAADLNATGDQNIRFSYLFSNDGFGNLIQFAGVQVPFMKANGTASWGDVNGDGLPDLLLNGDGYLNSGENNDSMWRIYQNVGGSSIQTAWEKNIARQGSMANGSLFVDWDNDGKLDFFAGGWNGTRQETALFLGNDPAAFTFTKSALSDTYFQGASEQGLLTADLNGDNKVDLLLNGFCGAPLGKRGAGYMVNQSANASIPPSAPTDLNANVTMSDGSISFEFSWKAPASETGKQGTTYNLSLKNTSTGQWFYNPMANVGGEKNGWRKVGGCMGNVFFNKEFFLYDLPAGDYEWTVQAINGAYIGGAFAQTQIFMVTSTNEISNKRLNIFSQNQKLIVNSYDSTTNGQINVYAINGHKVASQLYSGNAEIPLQQGLYIVEVVREGYNNTVSKIVVQ